MAGTNVIADGNEEIAADTLLIVAMIARTARWVHPQTHLQQSPAALPPVFPRKSLKNKERERLHKVIPGAKHKQIVEYRSHNQSLISDFVVV
jgi:hypothetical protein